MLIRLINTALILFAVFMGFKQGFAMIAVKPEMVEIFGKWNFSKAGLTAFGLIGILSALLILFPKTFIWGNFIMAASILLIICFRLFDKNMKGVLIELPFFFLNLLIIYFQHPLNRA